MPLASGENTPVSTIDQTLVQTAKESLDNEVTDYALYNALAANTKDPALSETFKHLAAMEQKHVRFWQKYVPDYRPAPNRSLIRRVLLLKRLFGLTFAIRYLERLEEKAIKSYESIAQLIPSSDMKAFDEMLEDERLHEGEFSSRTESSTIRYISFVVLGLADALVEISGIHAGSLGIYDKTEIAGLAGIIAGAAASLAMASAAYAQAKQGFKGSASISAAYTGISYFITAVVLATPYFLTHSQPLALGVSLVLAVTIVTLATYYSSVISSKPFLRDFIEILGILLAVTAALYLFGSFIRLETGITV